MTFEPSGMMLEVTAAMASQTVLRALDILTRVAILEGVAVVRPWSWLGRGDTVMALRALEKASTHLPDLDPQWLLTENTGVFLALYKGAKQVVDSETAMDIAQSAIGGFSRSKEVEGGQLYDTGKKLRSQIMSGAPPGIAIRFLLIHGKSRALDQIRQQQKEQGTGQVHLTPGQVEEGERFEIPSTHDEGAWRELLISGLTGGTGGQGAAIYKALKEGLQREWASAPAKMLIFDKWVEDPSKSAIALARELGYATSGTKSTGEKWEMGGLVSKVLQEMIRLAPKIIRRNPELLKEMAIQEELGALGYGARMATGDSRRAHNLAHLLSTYL